MREVKRKAKIGEKIKIVDAFFPFGSYKNGDVLTVLRVLGGEENDEHRVYVEEFEQPFILTGEYVVLEVEKEMRFKVGDKVRIAENTSAHRFEIGQPVRIKKVTISNYLAESLDGTEEWWVADKELGPAPFTLSDLKPCMVAKIRDGKTAIISMSQDNGMVMNSDNGCWVGLGNYSDTLESSVTNQHDVVEVYGFSKMPYRANEISTNDRELLFKREEPKPKRKMTIDEICKELGEEIEIVKGE